MVGDRQYYEPTLQRFVGQVCYRSVACNSIKLRFEELADPNQGYIWIDPPWSFMCHDQLITDAYLCPYHEDEDYEVRFDEWCKLFSPLDRTVLVSYEFTPNDSLSLFFSDSYQIYVPWDEEEPENGWYLHWYASTG